MNIGDDQPSVPPEALQVVDLLTRTFQDRLVAAYLHGSALDGGLRADSDVDLLAVLENCPTPMQKESLLGELLQISAPPRRGTRRPIELILFRRDALSEDYPPTAEFIFGEWLRQQFESGERPEPRPDPELTLLLAQARRQSLGLIGPAATELLPPIAQPDVRQALQDLLPLLLETLDGDERNVLLTLARIWRTLETGEFVSKDVAAEWVIARLPADAAALMGYARDAYLGTVDDDWLPHREAAHRLSGELRQRIDLAARCPSGNSRT